MERFPSLFAPSRPPRVIAAVGSGGKSSCLTLLAQRYRSQGRSVLLTTSTHMRQSAALCCSPSLPVLQEQLASTGFLFTGTPVPDGKIGPLPKAQYDALSQQADVTLVEADGSRGLPLKMPAQWEPVLPAKTDLVLVLLGLSGLGRPLQAVCHRWELAAQALECAVDCVVTPALAAQLLELGYLRPLRAAGLSVTILLNQVDTVDPAQAEALRQLLLPQRVYPLSLDVGGAGLPDFSLLY